MDERSGGVLYTRQELREPSQKGGVGRQTEDVL